jgi:biotin transport system substrate-specific component
MKNTSMQNNLILNNIHVLNKLDVLLKNTLVIILGSLVFALSARIKIDIPPVPVTLQTLVLLVFAMTVGWKLSTLTFLTYLLEGSLGLPFFANPPYGGLAYLMGPSGGYLLGMLIASYIVGYLAEANFDKNYFKSLFAIFIGTAIIFVIGLVWLTYWLSIQPQTTIDFLCNRENIQCQFSEWNISQSFNLALILGLFKFIITEPIKIALAATITPLIWQYIKKL